jgi:Xaa-Pro aminopeptidase
MSHAVFQSFKDKSEGALGPSRLKKLRGLLKERGLDGYLIARADEHQNEYLPSSEERLAWLSGFTGSAGFGIVLANEAAIFSDGRYTQQLAEQIDTTAFTPVSIIDNPPPDWLAAHAKKGARIGYDPARHTQAGLLRFQAAADKAGILLVPSEPNAVDAVWTDRPQAPSAQVIFHPLKVAGINSAVKIAELQDWLESEKLDALVITDPTCIAWLFNIRGGDVPHMPLPISYAILPKTGRPKLFINGQKLSNSVRSKLEDKIDVADTAQLQSALVALGANKAKVSFDRETASVALVESLRGVGGIADTITNPIALRKAVKNAAECEGTRQAHIRDGAAMAQFLYWFDMEAPKGNLTEISVAEQLEHIRSKTGLLKDISFDTISAAGPNAALPHYRVTEASNRKVGKGIYLIDSGGQYVDGTTDITRTIAVGKPTAEMIDRNTRVLKGMIAISQSVFPRGVSGAQIDSFARAYLWNAGLDFDHGTGHGVGSYLGVHEGPQRIAKAGTTPLEPGMMLSNEPGYYKTGHYGIRIENLVIVEDRVIVGAERKMLGFETITLCPIDKRLIKKSLLTAEELKWLNTYHARVYKVIAPLVDAPTKVWLKAACASL